jgi:hypothetical protein
LSPSLLGHRGFAASTLSNHAVLHARPRSQLGKRWLGVEHRCLATCRNLRDLDMGAKDEGKTTKICSLFSRPSAAQP